MRAYSCLLIAVLCVMCCGCATIYNPATQREEFVWIQTPQEVQLGRQLASQVEQQYTIIDDPVLVNKVQTIGQRIAAVSDRTDLTYHFGIIKDDEMNAFALPGGYLFVHSGLLKQATTNELACVMAHEIGHIAARHSVKALEASLGYNLLAGIILRGEDYQSFREASNTVFNIVHLKYSREDETLADKLGVRYAYEAGYDPHGLITFFEKLKGAMQEKGSSEGMLFLRSHPYLDQRIEAVKKEIAILEQNQ